MWKKNERSVLLERRLGYCRPVTFMQCLLQPLREWVVNISIRTHGLVERASVVLVQRQVSTQSERKIRLDRNVEVRKETRGATNMMHKTHIRDKVSPEGN